MARCCSNSHGTRASSAALLMSSSTAAVVVPLHLLLSYQRTSSSHFSSPAGRSCSLHQSGTGICRKSALRLPPLRGSQRRTKRRSASRPDGAAPRMISKLSLFQSQMCNMDLFALFQNIVSQRTELLIECFVRDNVVSIFHPFGLWPESHKQQSTPLPPWSS